MDPEHFKPILIRDKHFLEELYHSSSPSNSKRIIQNASDSKLKTLIIFLHLISSGAIQIKKENFNKLEKRHLKLFRTHFDKKGSSKKLIHSDRALQFKVLSKILNILPFLLHTLFNE